jgi:large subunit ribosomal protein L31
MYNSPDMKKDLHHKDYRVVVFEDLNNGTRILTRSTVATEDTVKWEDGNEYPLVKVHISSSSHPFFTGEERIVDIEGRVDKFKARQGAAQKAREEKASKKPRKSAEKVSAAQKLGATQPNR